MSILASLHRQLQQHKSNTLPFVTGMTQIVTSLCIWPFLEGIRMEIDFSPQHLLGACGSICIHATHACMTWIYIRSIYLRVDRNIVCKWLNVCLMSYSTCISRELRYGFLWFVFILVCCWTVLLGWGCRRVRVSTLYRLSYGWSISGVQP